LQFEAGDAAQAQPGSEQERNDSGAGAEVDHIAAQASVAGEVREQNRVEVDAVAARALEHPHPANLVARLALARLGPLSPDGEGVRVRGWLTARQRRHAPHPCPLSI